MNIRDDNTTEEPFDELELYVLDLLDDDERQLLEARLAGSDELRQRVRELRGTLGSLAFALEPMEPPSGLRERIQEQARAESGPVRLVAVDDDHAHEEPTSLFNSMPWVWAAAAVFALALVGALVFAADDGVGDLEAYPIATTDASVGAAGQVRVRQGAQQATLDLTGLQPLPSDQVYQVWLIADGAPVPNVTFTPDTSGEAHLVVHGELGEARVLAVTVEPTGGSPAPTTDPLLVSDLTAPGTV